MITSFFQTAFYIIETTIKSEFFEAIILILFTVWINKKVDNSAEKLKKELQEDNKEKIKKIKNQCIDECIKFVGPIIEKLEKENNELKQKVHKKPIHINFPT
jgi:Mg2+ and Co2+ transporter CorA